MSIKVGDIVTPDIRTSWGKPSRIMTDARLFRVIELVGTNHVEVQGLYETEGAIRVYQVDSLMECNNLYCNKYFDTELGKLK